MGRGTPLLWTTVWENFVEQFKNNVSQCTIARNLGISSYMVHNIIKRFRESGENSAHKQQGRKPTLNAHDLWSLGRPCIKTLHQCEKDITTWAQEHFRKLLSVNTVRRNICKCNKTLLCKVKAICQQHLETPPASLGLRWTDANWESLLWSDGSTEHFPTLHQSILDELGPREAGGVSRCC